MIKSALPYLIPAATAFTGWLFGFIYHRKERKNDLSIKLIKQIEDLTDKYVELNNKYALLSYEFCALRRKNDKLIIAITTINPDFNIKENTK